MGAEYLSGGKVTKWLFYFMKKHTGIPYFFGVDENNFIYCANYRYIPNFKDLKQLQKACNKTIKMYKKEKIFQNQIDEFNENPR